MKPTITKIKTEIPLEMYSPEISYEKRKWLKSIGAAELPEPMKFIYPGLSCDVRLMSMRDVMEKPLESLQDDYEREMSIYTKQVSLKLEDSRNLSVYGTVMPDTDMSE